jgi:hypothetical protein
MVELYWRALMRDVRFHEYEDNPLVAVAAAEPVDLDGYHGPGADSRVTHDTVFRGVTSENQQGSYVSQLLWKDRDLGRGTINQRIRSPVAETTPADYMTTKEDWLKIQNALVKDIVDGPSSCGCGTSGVKS